MVFSGNADLFSIFFEREPDGPVIGRLSTRDLLCQASKHCLFLSPLADILSFEVHRPACDHFFDIEQLSFFFATILQRPIIEANADQTKVPS